jgi:dTDP-4-amino-4,6-dideoxygalactose transaminase
MIPFNKPFFTGKEVSYINDAVYQQGQISGNGKYTKLCQRFFETNLNVSKCLLTTSCTDALEMTALLLNILPGDEIIVPSYTFVSSALAFVRQGARIVFCDSRPDFPGMNEDLIEPLITGRTKAIVVVHYAGIACDMKKINEIAKRNNLFVVEDAAQAINSYYLDQPLGTMGHMGCYSFHETKNISSGEGGLLIINKSDFIERAEIVWEKGTNREAFFRGEIDKYGWVDTGSSFLPSDINAAVLYAQIEKLDTIQKRRCEIWNQYYHALKPLEDQEIIRLPYLPQYATNNGHMFYIVCESLEVRSRLISHLRSNEILAVFHYQSLHKSKFYENRSKQDLPYADMYSDCLVRLPLFYELKDEEIDRICHEVISFFR